MKYSVYVILRLQKDCETIEKEVLVCNVEAQSNGGAEHKILDSCAGVDNALAFSAAEACGKYFTEIFPRCTVYDFRDFKRRCAALRAHRIEVLEMLHDEMERAAAELRRAELQLQTAQLEAIAARTDLQNAAEAFREAQRVYGLQNYVPEDECPGIA